MPLMLDAALSSMGHFLVPFIHPKARLGMKRRPYKVA